MFEGQRPQSLLNDPDFSKETQLDSLEKQATVLHNDIIDILVKIDEDLDEEIRFTEDMKVSRQPLEPNQQLYIRYFDGAREI